MEHLHLPTTPPPPLDPTKLKLDLAPFMRLYTDGTIERLGDTDTVPPSLDPVTGVASKDVVIDPETGASARLFLPTRRKNLLPLVVYYHGGGFCVGSAKSRAYHGSVGSLCAEAGAVAVSVDYRLAPEHPVPAAHDDSWTALKWVASHACRDGPEEWLNDCVDFERVCLAGDSAGANICHHMAMKAGSTQSGDKGFSITGIILIHPYFWGTAPVGAEAARAGFRELQDEIWAMVCPASTAGSDDPLVNPMADSAPGLEGLGCRRALVCVAEMDGLRDRGRLYFERLRTSEWEGTVEIYESAGEGHVFHMFKPGCDGARGLTKRVASFISAL
ncbi:putative carboxylesterase 2 [Acorus gramineus]|uniref:Carboxylesterase 2 n=1 Tax=Acorus gramineus TaxID=55184 RepID=A0AAV9AIX8_ACOGR|nr:putative carboxylesterase 2 [Acorus gramineus]